MTAGSGLPRHPGGVVVVSSSAGGGGGVLSSGGSKTGRGVARAPMAAWIPASSSLPVQGPTSASRSS